MDFIPGDVLRIRETWNFSKQGKPAQHLQTVKDGAVTLVVVLGEEPIRISKETPGESPDALMNRLGWVNVGRLPEPLKNRVAAHVRSRRRR